MNRRNLISLCLLAAVGAYAPAPAAQPGAAPLPVGVVYDYDAAAGQIWIGDKLYTLHPRLRVIGHGSKLGVLSAIQKGEVIEYAAEANPDQPYQPYIVEIHRK